MSLALRERRGASERCPYCHDCLEGGQIADARVVCEGCGTTHHAACLAELGGCTVMGCPVMSCSGGLAQPLGGVDAVRARVRERVQRFVLARPDVPKEENLVPPPPEGWTCARCFQHFSSAQCLSCGHELDAICREEGHPCAGCGRRHPSWREPLDASQSARSQLFDWVLGIGVLWVIAVSIVVIAVLL